VERGEISTTSRHKSLDHLTAHPYHPPVLRGSARPHTTALSPGASYRGQGGSNRGETGTHSGNRNLRTLWAITIRPAARCSPDTSSGEIRVACCRTQRHTHTRPRSPHARTRAPTQRERVARRRNRLVSPRHVVDIADPPWRRRGTKSRPGEPYCPPHHTPPRHHPARHRQRPVVADARIAPGAERARTPAHHHAAAVVAGSRVEISRSP
jgi:hypothetical protein